MQAVHIDRRAHGLAIRARSRAVSTYMSHRTSWNNRPRRFPVPSTFEDHNGTCIIVRDTNGLAVAYLYYEQEPGRRTAANLMTEDEARRIAANIVKLPGLLGKDAPR